MAHDPAHRTLSLLLLLSSFYAGAAHRVVIELDAPNASEAAVDGVDRVVARVTVGSEHTVSARGSKLKNGGRQQVEAVALAGTRRLESERS